MSLLDEIRGAAKSEPSQETKVLPGPGPKYVPKVPYQAFGAPTSDPQIRLMIYAKKFSMMPRYDVLYDVFFDGAWEHVGLIFPHHRITIYGENLMGLVNALRTNSVEWIREYNGFFHEALPPGEELLPIITSIDVDHVDNPFHSETNTAGA